jgi:hypothetical protein
MRDVRAAVVAGDDLVRVERVDDEGMEIDMDSGTAGAAESAITGIARSAHI